MFVDSFIVRLVNIILMLFIVFLMYQFIYSGSGILQKSTLEQKLRTEQKQLQLIHQKNMEKEHRISLLRQDNMDLDMLEEQNRRLFNTRKEGEIQVILD